MNPSLALLMTFAVSVGATPEKGKVISSSGSLSQVVNQAATTTAVVSSLNPSTFGQSVIFTATVTGVQGIPPTGTVTFKDGATVIGSGSLASGQASFTISTLAVGSHQITAVYAGNTNYTGSTSGNLTQTVNQAPTTTTVQSSLNPSMYGQPITFTATVTGGPGIPTGTVTFKDGATVLGTGTLALVGGQAKATFTTSTPLSVAAHSITAVYAGDTSFAGSTSAVFTQTVNKAGTTTTLVSSSNPGHVGVPVTFTATVAPAMINQGQATPTGTVQFWEIDPNTGQNIALLATVTLDATGHAAFTTSFATMGMHRIKALYLGDTNYLTSFVTFDEMVMM